LPGAEQLEIKEESPQVIGILMAPCAGLYNILEKVPQVQLIVLVHALKLISSNAKLLPKKPVEPVLNSNTNGPVVGATQDALSFTQTSGDSGVGTVPKE
jgi:hypothetical protein